MVFSNMQFDNLPPSPYLNIVSDIIRRGINKCKDKINIYDNEGLKNQKLVDTFNLIGTTDEKIWIGVGKENVSENKQAREDIYFYLNNDAHTRIFYVEGKRLPKYNTKNTDEYVVGTNKFGNPSGGIERFKKGIHGEPNQIINNGLIAYVENNSIDFWFEKVNLEIQQEYESDEIMKPKEYFLNEYVSTHKYNCESNFTIFHIHHFWIELVNS